MLLIPDTSSVAHLRENVAVSGLSLSPDLLSWIGQAIQQEVG